VYDRRAGSQHVYDHSYATCQALSRNQCRQQMHKQAPFHAFFSLNEASFRYYDSTTLIWQMPLVKQRKVKGLPRNNWKTAAIALGRTQSPDFAAVNWVTKIY
jgi:hypothetical protein